MTRIYATPDQLAAYTGQPAPAGAEQLLTRAGRMLDALVLRLCRYDVDGTGMPTDPAVRQAIGDAVCAQVAWWDELGDSTGAAGAGWGSISIGSVALGRSVTAVSGADAPARHIAPEVGDILAAPDLAGLLRVGVVW